MRIKKIYFLISLVSILFMINAWGQNADTQLSNLLSGLQTMQANFTQMSYDNGGKLLQKSTGIMALQRPGKFRWEIQAPQKQLLIADGQYVWIYDVDLQQATKRAMNASQNTNPASLLSGSTAALQQRFSITNLNKSPGQWFELKPIAKSDMFKSIQLHFQNNILDQMILSDNLGQQSVVTFSQVKTNVSLNSNLFQFSPPKGTDVFNQ